MLAKVLADAHYRDIRALVMALADVLKAQVQGVDAEVIQVDEANITGHADDGPIAAAGINRVLEGVRGEKAVHLCFGNYGGQTMQQGTYAKLLAFLNALEVDHLVLELARRPAAGTASVPRREALDRTGHRRDRHQGQRGGNARRGGPADRAGRRSASGAERIRYVHPDCGFWMLPRSVADAKMRSLVAGRDLAGGTK